MVIPFINIVSIFPGSYYNKMVKEIPDFIKKKTNKPTEKWAGGVNIMAHGKEIMRNHSSAW